MHQAADSMIVQLILATGSNAGIAAPIHPGYYMVGRHPECQIRPKTRSVSRRHLLIHHDQSALLVIDLGSTSGTRINEEKIESKRWYPISDGDILRLGKTVFNVSIQSKVSALPKAELAPTLNLKHVNTSDATARDVSALSEPSVINSASPPAKSPASFVQGEAWQEIDIASFLHSADEADRENRYESIRRSDALRRAEDFDEDEGGVFEDTPVESDEGTLTDIDSRLEAQKATLKTEPATASIAAKEAAVASVTRGPSATRAAARRIEPATRKSRRFFPRLSLGNLADFQSKNLVLAVAVTIGVLGYAGYAAYQFVQGPQTKIVEDID